MKNPAASLPFETTRYLFFTGKGGVGKTSLACATALQLADAGQHVLLVSTDPASNLSDVLESEVNAIASPVRGQSMLDAINIDPEAAADAYRSRVIEPLRGTLPGPEIIKLTEGLSGACTTEIASFDEFARYVAGEGDAAAYDVIVFDTAPTGHTLRLLELPEAWSAFAKTNPAGASCLGPASALNNSQARYQMVVDRLRDAAMTTFCIVSRADKYALSEAARTCEELNDLGMAHQVLLINGVFKPQDGLNDPIASKLSAMAAAHLADLPAGLASLPRATFPLLSYNVLGLDRLRALLDPEKRRIFLQNYHAEPGQRRPLLPDLSALVDELADGNGHGLIMTMGKGGVGKTLAAASIATLLARRGFQVHLTTTDPAAHIEQFMGQVQDLPPTLTIDHIDAKQETQRYMDKVLALKGKNLDDAGKRLLAEDLKSPCTEEVAVFGAFSKAIQLAKRQFVVIDTAPTGHTLLLLDTTGAYHKEIMKHSTLAPDRIKTPFMFLQDHDFAKILLVSLSETTPMREAASLQADLARSGIRPYAWVVNQCLSAVPHLRNPLLQHRAAAEVAIVQNIVQNLAERTFGIPFIVEENVLGAVVDAKAMTVNA
jgi:arsenite/tail-anchored protein-transporting ATPase